jgi:hypothetical protein
MKRCPALTITALLVAASTAFAQGPDGEPATPTTLIENAQSRIVRVDILANSTRSMHNHPDMLWHVFVTMNDPIVLTIQGEASPVKLGPWQTHFFKGGTTHAITNPNPRVAQFLEFFSKKAGAAASIETIEDAMRTLAATLARAAAEAIENQSAGDRR